MIGRCYISYCTVLCALLGPAECRAHYNYNIDFTVGGAINACDCGDCLVPLFCTAAGCITVRTRYIHIESHGRAPNGIAAPNSHSAFAVRC